jgi:hypothetical protein
MDDKEYDTIQNDWYHILGRQFARNYRQCTCLLCKCYRICWCFGASIGNSLWFVRSSLFWRTIRHDKKNLWDGLVHQARLPGRSFSKSWGILQTNVQFNRWCFFHLSLVYSRVKTQNASDFHGCLHGYKWGYKQFSWCYFTDIHNWYFDVFWTITAQTGHHSADFLISQAVEAHLLSLLP